MFGDKLYFSSKSEISALPPVDDFQVKPPAIDPVPKIWFQIQQEWEILSDIDGFYDHDPRLYSNAKLIERITTIDENIQCLAGGAGSRRGTGGMRTKLKAAKLATEQGIDTIITSGKTPEALYDIINGRPIGTLFVGKYLKN